MVSWVSLSIQFQGIKRETLWYLNDDPRISEPRDDEQRKLWSMATGGILFGIYTPDFQRKDKKTSHIYSSIQLVNKLMNFNNVPILASMGVRDIYLKAGSNALNEKDIEPIFFSVMFKFLDSEICCDITRS